MRETIERNRTRMLKTALEVLRDNIVEMLAHCNYELAPYSEAKAKKYDEQHEPLDAALASFDDALFACVDARNEFAEAQNLETKNLRLDYSTLKKNR